MLKRQGIWAVFAALAAANTMFASVTPTSAFRHVYPLHSKGRVTIQNLYGNVSISAWDRDEVLVEAVRQASAPEHLSDMRILVEPTADSLAIRTQYAGTDADHPTSVEFRLTVPRGVRLENIVLTNGQLSLTGLAGPVKASAVNGDIHAQKMRGQAELSTINGKVDADFDRTSADSPISLSSVNGAIHLTIPTGTGASLEAVARSGGIASDVGRVFRTEAGHRLTTHGAGPQIRLHNVNGGISIRANERPWT